MRSSKDFLEEEFDDLNEIEYIQNLASKQFKQLKSSFRQKTTQKKVLVRNKRLEKEHQKETIFAVKPSR